MNWRDEIFFIIGVVVGACGMAMLTVPARGAERLPDNLFIPSTQSFFIANANRAMVTIKPDGTVVYGEGYTPDAAAKALWDAVGVERKARNCQ